MIYFQYSLKGVVSKNMKEGFIDVNHKTQNKWILVEYIILE